MVVALLWTVAWTFGLCVIYGLNLPKVSVDGVPLSATVNAIYGGWHRLGWASAVAWVVFACCRGYGGT